MLHLARALRWQLPPTFGRKAGRAEYLAPLHFNSFLFAQAVLDRSLYRSCESSKPSHLHLHLNPISGNVRLVPTPVGWCRPFDRGYCCTKDLRHITRKPEALARHTNHSVTCHLVCNIRSSNVRRGGPPIKGTVRITANKHHIRRDYHTAVLMSVTNTTSARET